jgi:hypothetical protein
MVCRSGVAMKSCCARIQKGDHLQRLQDLETLSEVRDMMDCQLQGRSPITMNFALVCDSTHYVS